MTMYYCIIIIGTLTEERFAHHNVHHLPGSGWKARSHPQNSKFFTCTLTIQEVIHSYDLQINFPSHFLLQIPPESGRYI